MADRKLSDSTALTGAQVDAANDQLMILDVSDTTDGAGGTNKKITPTEFLKLFRSYFRNVADTFTSIFQNANTAARTYTFQDRDGTIADIYNPNVIGASRNRYICAAVTAQAPTTGAVSINTLRAGPFVVTYPMTIDRIACEVTTGTSGKIRLGIWSDDGTGYPSTLILDGGEQTITAPGVYGTSTSVSVTLQPGLYWVGFLTDTANQFRVGNTANYSPTMGISSTFGAFISINWGISLAYGALPNPFTAGATVQTSNVPLIGFRIP